MLEPSTDSGRLLVPTEIFFSVLGLGVLWEGRHKWGVLLRFFGQLYQALGASLMAQIFAQGFIGI